MFLQTIPVESLSTGNPRIDAGIQTAIIITSIAGTLASIWGAKRKQKKARPAPRRHTPAPVPQTRQQKELDALNARG